MSGSLMLETFQTTSKNRVTDGKAEGFVKDWLVELVKLEEVICLSNLKTETIVTD